MEGLCDTSHAHNCVGHDANTRLDTLVLRDLVPANLPTHLVQPTNLLFSSQLEYVLL